MGSTRLRVDSRVAGQLNRAAVFSVLRAHQVVSRVGLARETGLSKATISQIVDQLLRDGFVQTVGPGESHKGRRPTLLRFNPRARYAIGVELGESSCTAILADLNGAAVRSASQAVGIAVPEAALDTAAAVVAELAAAIPPHRLVGIGVGTPGLVDSSRGIIQLAPDLGWTNVAVAQPLAERFGVPVAVVNRAKAAAIGEAWCGAGRDVDKLVYVSVSTGIAAGIVIDQRLYRGVSMSEGELGHVTVIPDGPLCGCGNRGCLQTVAASSAILARVRERLRSDPVAPSDWIERELLDGLTLPRLSEAAVAGDPRVLGVLDEVAGYLGIAVANLVNLLNPRMLILGGSVIRALPMLIPRIEAVVRRRAMAVPAAAARVVASQLGANAVPIGAAAFVLGEVPIVGRSVAPADNELAVAPAADGTGRRQSGGHRR